MIPAMLSRRLLSQSSPAAVLPLLFPFSFGNRSSRSGKLIEINLDSALHSSSSTSSSSLVDSDGESIECTKYQNFRELCTGERGIRRTGFISKGGDFTAGNGTRAESIYGAKLVDKIPVLHIYGQDWLHGKHVVFRIVVEGMDIVKAIERVGSTSGRTYKTVDITDRSQLS